MAIHFHKVTIIGVGLIGGSLAKVLRTSGLAGSITGSGRSSETLELALRLGVIDQMGLGPKHAVEGADLVVLASPVGTFEDVVREIGPHLKRGAILTDVGSVKGELVHRIEKILPAGIHFVPAHPIAGKEKFGVAEATEKLFQGAKCILTPTKRTEIAALNTLREVWTTAGSNVIIMDPDLHDVIFAAVSHMPHVAAFAMMCAVAELNTGTDNYLNFSGAGFRDFTRIAASSPEIWRDICLMNRGNIVQMLDRFLFSLNRIKRDLVANDAKRLEMHLKIASDARRGLG
ncbi:MAG TPA: prephenate dehydrogenase/arogenate dehydrogenase family protein [Nitrospirota bacterium]|nr:prephenate dehydrogenase/arogenate dehydrogenase family protein [Nitrospirota bacterium]